MASDSPPTVDELWAAVQPRPAGFFDAFRVGQYPTLYPAQYTAAEADVLEFGFIFAAVILALSLLLILPGVRTRSRVGTLVQILVAVFVLAAIMLSNFGQDWEVAEVRTRTQYRAGLRQDVNATVGVKIGLRSINITLKGLPEVQTFSGSLVNETINYNERVSWDNRGWLVGRGGFGPYAGRFNQEFKALQRRGSPYPILWVAEYFSLDGEGVRWGRFYLQAGYYTHIVLWTALPLWFLTLILFKLVVRYGAYFSVLTGIAMLSGNAIYANLRNPFPLVIPFEDDHLVFHWGPSFWLCVATGLLCCVVGVVALILDTTHQEMVAHFFSVDIILDHDEYYVDSDDVIKNGDVTLSDDVTLTDGWSRLSKQRSRRATVVLKQSETTPPRGTAALRVLPNGGVSAGAVVLHDAMDQQPGDLEMQPRGSDLQADPWSQAGHGSQARPGLQETPGSEPAVVHTERGFERRSVFSTYRKSRKQNPRPTVTDSPIPIDSHL